MENGFNQIIESQRCKEYYISLEKFLNEEYENYTIYPPREEIFEAMKLCDYSDVKVVILGQDPYHGQGEAHGLSFSVKKDIKIPPSLRNIFKELELEGDFSIPSSGDLTSWAKQGVLLLNTVLTVREKSPNSHKNKGWEIFTDHIIKSLNENEEPIVFLFWGANAKTKEKYITNPKHLVLTAVHPSPLSVYRGFFGCNHFKLANEFLKENNRKEIVWSL